MSALGGCGNSNKTDFPPVTFESIFRRLVTVYNRTYRGKYAWFIKQKIMAGCWTVATAVYLIRSAMFYGQKSEHFSRYPVAVWGQ